MREKFSEVFTSLREIVGDEYLLTDPTAMYAYVRDTGIVEGIPPIAVVRPGTVDEVSRILKMANVHKIPIFLRGGGSSYSGTGIPFKKDGIVMELTRLKGIYDVDLDANVVEVWAGTTWVALRHELKKRGLTTGYSTPASGYSATVGGSVSVASVGAGSARYGPPSEQVVGLEVVLPTGDIIKTGSGASVKTKNFYRYVFGPDLTGLFTGDHGVLGVKTKVTLKLYQYPDYEEYLEYGFKSEKEAAKSVSEFLRNNICLCDLFAFDKFGTEVRAKRVTYWQGYESVLMVRLASQSANAIDSQKCLLKSIAKKNGGKELPEAAMAKALIGNFTEAFFQARRDAGFSIGVTIVVPPGKVAEFWNYMRGFIQNLGAEWTKYVNYSGMVLISSANACEVVPTFYIPYEYNLDPDAKNKIRELWHKFYNEATDIGGCIFMMGKGLAPIVFRKLSPSYIEVLRNLKRTLDPNNILNPDIWPLG